MGSFQINTNKMFASLSDGTEMSLPLVSGPVVNSGDVQTDSYGSRSDASGGKVASRPKMEVVCVIDLHSHQFLSDRKRAFEEVSAAMNNVSLTHIQVSMFIPTQGIRMPIVKSNMALRETKNNLLAKKIVLV